MIETVSDFRQRLMKLDPFADEFVIEADALLEALDPGIADAVYPAIFEFFEATPGADCGMPGSLVHWVERFYPNYVEALKDSVRRTPSHNGVLMINRILNSSLPAPERAGWMELLRAVATGPDAEGEIATMAARFLERRSNIDSESC